MSDSDPAQASIDTEALSCKMLDVLEFTAKQPSDEPGYMYPERILQQSTKGNRYYGSFQRYDRQFIPSNDDAAVITLGRFNNSKIQVELKKIIDEWVASERQGGDAQTSSAATIETKKVAPANALFSWSSGESYVQERRKQIEEKKKRKSLHGGGFSLATGADEQALNRSKDDKDRNEDKNKDITQIDSYDSSNKSNTNKSNTKNSFANVDKDLDHRDKGARSKTKQPINAELNKVIEFESNTFIHARIQKIKAHHNEQISKQIHDRKRRDHEDHLHRLKLKEDEYEKKLLSASQKSGGFFGAIFGFNSTGTTKKDDEQYNSSANTPTTPTVAQFGSFVDESHESLPSTKEFTKSKRFSFLPTPWTKKGTGTPEIDSASEADGILEEPEVHFDLEAGAAGSLKDAELESEGVAQAETQRTEPEVREQETNTLPEVIVFSASIPAAVSPAVPPAAPKAPKKDLERPAQLSFAQSHPALIHIQPLIPSPRSPPTVIPPSTLTPVKKSFSQSTAPTPPPKVDEEDDFMEFTSPAPQPQASKSGNRSFIPLPSIANTDLIGLFPEPDDSHAH